MNVLITAITIHASIAAKKLSTSIPGIIHDIKTINKEYSKNLKNAFNIINLLSLIMLNRNNSLIPLYGN